MKNNPHSLFTVFNLNKTVWTLWHNKRQERWNQMAYISASFCFLHTLKIIPTVEFQTCTITSCGPLSLPGAYFGFSSVVSEWNSTLEWETTLGCFSWVNVMTDIQAGGGAPTQKDEVTVCVNALQPPAQAACDMPPLPTMKPQWSRRDFSRALRSMYPNMTMSWIRKDVGLSCRRCKEKSNANWFW